MRYDASSFDNDGNSVPKYTFPSDFVDPKIKETNEYGINFARAIYSKFVYDNSTNSNTVSNYITNRKYSEGMQSIQKYKDLMGVQGDLSVLNLDWSVISVIPKFVDIMVNKIVNQDHKITCDAIDPVSKTRLDETRNKYYANMLLKDFNEDVKKITGVPVIPEGEFVPESDEDLELHMELNFKQDTEIVMEQAIDFVMLYNDWDAIKSRVVRDLVENKKGALRVYWDSNNNIRMRYVDIVKLITTYSDDPDFKDCTYWGEMVPMTIGELRRVSNGNLSEEDLFTIAKQYQGKNENRRWSYGNDYYNYNNSNTGDGYAYDDFRIDVLDFVFHSIDTSVHEKKSNKHDGFYFGEKDFHYQKPKKSKYEREMVKTRSETAYEGYWVVGTKYMARYGKSKNMTRPWNNGKYEPTLHPQYVMFAPNMRGMDNKSTVERCRPFADQIQLLSLKVQQFIAESAPPGLRIDVSAIKDIDLGGGKQGKMKPLDLIKLYRQKGIVLYDGLGEDGTPRNISPIDSLDNGVSAGIIRLIELIEYNYNQIRNVTGLNEAVDGSTPDKKALIGTQKLAIESSNNATRAIDEGYLRIYRKTATTVSRMIQDITRFGKGLEGFEMSIGSSGVKTIEIGKDMSLAEMGINITPMPDAEERARLEVNVAQAVANGQLNPEDSFLITRIGASNVKYAERYLALRSKKKKEQDMMMEQQMQQARAQSDAMSAQGAAQARIMEAQAKSQLDAQKSKMQAEASLKLEELKHKNKMEEIQLQNEWKTIHIEKASEEDFKNKDLTKEAPQPGVLPKNLSSPSNIL